MANGTIPSGAIGLDTYTLVQDTPKAQIHFLTGWADGAQVGCIIVVDSEMDRKSASFVLTHDSDASTNTYQVFTSADERIQLTLITNSNALIHTTTDLNIGNAGNPVDLKRYTLPPDDTSTGYWHENAFYLNTALNGEPVQMSSNSVDIIDR